MCWETIRLRGHTTTPRSATLCASRLRLARSLRPASSTSAQGFKHTALAAPCCKMIHRHQPLLGVVQVARCLVWNVYKLGVSGNSLARHSTHTNKLAVCLSHPQSLPHPQHTHHPPTPHPHAQCCWLSPSSTSSPLELCRDCCRCVVMIDVCCCCCVWLVGWEGGVACRRWMGRWVAYRCRI